MSRRSRRAAQQRIETRARQQAARDAAAREPDKLERDRMTARHEAELYGYVQIPAGCSFYLRHLGLNDVLPGPPATHAAHPLPPVLRRNRP